MWQLLYAMIVVTAFALLVLSSITLASRSLSTVGWGVMVAQILLLVLHTFFIIGVLFVKVKWMNNFSKTLFFMLGLFAVVVHIFALVLYILDRNDTLVNQTRRVSIGGLNIGAAALAMASVLLAALKTTNTPA